MARRIRVRGIPRTEPDVRLYVLALIELARQIQAEEEAVKTSETPRPDNAAREADHD
jgi:hypothetical protein